ncbi:hypothetical protein METBISCDRAFT_25852 [Metschnikowia bicuspidata]|uniref:Uncharacterized protein n=1 Tax=Metschnikowia bicuspidata TaxID=27322 RepID=A0A4V1J3K1_9ASCO|nr:hypothetical protein METBISCDRAFT_25852 [Metschnikowia bicuspidata]
MKLATLAIFVCLSVLTDAKKSKNENSPAEKANVPMAVKMDTYKLVPLQLVVENNIANNADFVPLNPFNEDLKQGAEPAPAAPLPSTAPFVPPATDTTNPPPTEIIAAPITASTIVETLSTSLVSVGATPTMSSTATSESSSVALPAVAEGSRTFRVENALNRGAQFALSGVVGILVLLVSLAFLGTL